MRSANTRSNNPLIDSPLLQDAFRLDNPGLSATPKRRAVAMALLAALVFAFSWLFRFNDPGGAFAGLTDDHFFYVVRGWQILFGELPVRDFVDHGAPLYYYLAAAVQTVFGRGTLSEVAFSVTMLSAAAALTFWLAARASGWMLLGLAGVAFHILLEPRYYNYPKVLVYALAIPLLWRFADRQDGWSRAGLAAITAIGFLFRHDHGGLVALAVAALLALMTGTPWRDRLRHAAVYGALVIAMLAPYLAFIELNGGFLQYTEQSAAWAARERARAPIEFPGLFDNPDGASPASTGPAGPARAIAAIRDNWVAWLFYAEIALPFIALLVLLLSREAARPDWRHGAAKIGSVAVLGVALNDFFLRSPLEARLADPSVPHAILIAWLLATVPVLLFKRAAWRPSRAWQIGAGRVAVTGVTVILIAVIAVAQTGTVRRRLESAAVNQGATRAVERAAHVAGVLRTEWEPEWWEQQEKRPELITLSLYLYRCTRPDDRVFVQMYMPQVLALARRGFAGGHADLRPGFFTSEAAQALTLERLQRQSVPVVLLETPDEGDGFRESFPRIQAYFDERYDVAGQHRFDERFPVTLLVRKDSAATRRYEPLGWPCPYPQ
jgi:hypothetical protein